MDEIQTQYQFMEEAAGYLRDIESEIGHSLRAIVVTFGCQMNERDSEKLRGILFRIGYGEAQSEEEADLIIYNTCTVRENADVRVFGRLGVLKSLKREKPHLIIGLCGCMMQDGETADLVKKKYPHVDLIFGTHNQHKLAEYLVKVFREKGSFEIWSESGGIYENLPVSRKYSFKSGLNIMYGCNNFCSYCIVPYVRGRERSRKLEDILREAEGLCADGVKEIMLLGQNVNSYGRGLDPPASFPELLGELQKIEGLKRIRFMSSHPKDLSDELMEAMAGNDKVCRHIHLAMQSGSTEILKKMNRHYSKDDYLEVIDKLRRAMPDIAITTDIIVGFPGETEEDVCQTIDAAERARFDGAFTFIYSKRHGTPAAKMQDDTPKEVIQERFDRVLSVVRKTAEEQAKRFEGAVLPVLVESVNRSDSKMVTGRIPQNHTVHLKGSADLIGSILNVRLDRSMGFYYIGSEA